MTETKTFHDTLTDLNACSEAVEWAEQFDTWEALWKYCERGDWMLWIIAKFAGEPEGEKRKPLVMAACECARLALPYVKKGDERPLKAIETAEAWTRGEVSIQEARKAAAAAYAAYAAADDAAYAAADAAAYAAADAAYAAADDAAYAAYAAAAAAAYAAYAARKDTLKQCADIVRKHFPDFKPEA